MKYATGRRRVYCLASAITGVAGLFTATASAQTPPPSGYQIASIGLSGGEYERAYSGGISRDTYANSMNASGQVTGTSAHYNASGMSLGYDVWLYSGGTSRAISLAGGDYEKLNTQYTGGGYYRNSSVTGMDSTGRVIGITQRYEGGQDATGTDAWLYSGGTTQVIGLTGTDYEYTNGNGRQHRYARLGGFASSGQILGNSQRFNASGASLGWDVWLYGNGTTQRIGPTGGPYEYSYSSGGTYRSSSALGIIGTQDVVGSSGRYTATGTSLGNEAWIYSNGTTQLIGLFGTGHEYTLASSVYRNNVALTVTAGGQVTGRTNRYNASGTAIGYDAWVYSGGTTYLAGLTGTEYEYTYSGGGTYRSSSDPLANASGQAAGNSARYNVSGVSLGRDAWVFNNGTTQRIGLSGANYQYTVSGGTYRESYTTAINPSGKVVGYTSRRNASGTSLGQDAWIHNGTTTQLIGLTGGPYDYNYAGGTMRDGVAAQINTAGKVVGTSVRHDNTGNHIGKDAWYYNGAATSFIGLTGAGYEYATGGGLFRNANITQLNEAGQAIGYTERYDASGNSLGQSGWFFDEATNTTKPLEFSIRAANNYSSTTPTLLTEAGVVLGSYILYDGSQYVGTHAFWWSAETGGGFRDLGLLVNGDLTTAGWQSLESIYGNATPGTIGTVAGNSPAYILGSVQIFHQTGGSSAFLLTAVTPEPGVMALALVAGSLALCQRRRS